MTDTAAPPSPADIRVVTIRHRAKYILTIILLYISIWGCETAAPAVELATTTPDDELTASFDGQRAYQDIERQVEFGPRTPDSPGRTELIVWLQHELQQSGWSVEVQSTEQMGFPIKNVIARRGEGHPWIILGTHYDTRLLSDQEPEPVDQVIPVPGANDGASGVAVLLELARVLPAEFESGQVWLVFFDAEDNGGIQGRDWILGSRAFVNSLTAQPDAAVIVDMIGDRDLEIYLERSSDLQLATEIWSMASDLGYSEIFIPLPKYRILDDHTPFVAAGIPAVLLIDFDYPYWHTTQDTLDKVSADSLQVVGNTLETWLEAQLSP